MVEGGYCWPLFFLVSMTNLLDHLFNKTGFWSVSKDVGTSSSGTEEFLAIRHSSKILRAHLVFLDVLGGLYPFSRSWASFSDTKENFFLVSELETAWSGSGRRGGSGSSASGRVREGWGSLDTSCKGRREGWGSRRDSEGWGSRGKGRRTGWGWYWMGKSVQSHIPRQNWSRTHACSNSSIAVVTKLVFCIQGEVAIGSKHFLLP